MKPHWTPRRHLQVLTVLEGDVFPKIGALPIRQVSARMIGSIMEAVEKRGAAVTAINIRQWCSAIFAYAVRKQAADGDPTGVNLKGRGKRPAVQHKTPLTQAQIPAILKKIEGGSAQPNTKIALQLLMLIFVRPGELRQAEWVEFDLDQGEWVIPPKKMKKREEHVIPLSTQAVRLLRLLHELTGPRGWLFPNTQTPDTCMSPATLNKALVKIGCKGKFSPHGFRATASTLLHGMGFDPKLIEFQLAHKERNRTAASYNQYAYIAERREMLQKWADLIDAWVRGDKVVPGRFRQGSVIVRPSD